MNTRIRLAHRIAVDGVGSISDELRPIAQFFVNDFSSSRPTVVVIDNIVQSVWKTSINYESLSDIPCIASPFRSVFLEYINPGLEVMHGTLVSTVDKNDKSQSLDGFIGSRPYGYMIPTSFTSVLFSNECRWFSEYSFVNSGVSGNRSVHIPGTILVAINSSGKAILEQAMCVVGLEHFEEVMRITAVLSGAAFAFMSCKNTFTVDVPGDMLPETKWMRRHRNKLGQMQFKTLRVDRIGRSSGHDQNGDDGDKNRFHICRGSFAEYSEERPLFGKYTGRFWRPAHVKGSKEVGEVVKEYDLGPRDQSEIVDEPE